jgi:hypothetical protein
MKTEWLKHSELECWRLCILHPAIDANVGFIEITRIAIIPSQGIDGWTVIREGNEIIDGLTMCEAKAFGEDKLAWTITKEGEK